MKTSDLPIIREYSISDFRDAYVFIDINESGKEKAGRVRLSSALNHVLSHFGSLDKVFAFTNDRPASFDGLSYIKVSEEG